MLESQFQEKVQGPIFAYLKLGKLLDPPIHICLQLHEMAVANQSLILKMEKGISKSYE